MSALSAARSIRGQLEPANRAFIETLVGRKPIYTLSLEAARDVFAAARKSISVILAPASSEVTVGRKGRMTSVFIVRRMPKVRCPW